MADPKPPARLRLRVTARAETILRSGHPWLYSDSIREQNRPGTAGELAVVFDREDKFLAVGLFEPESPIRFRCLHVGKPANVDTTWWRRRLQETIARRAGLFGPETTGYRLIHGESDGWPALVMDRYGDVLVLKLYSPVWILHFALLKELLAEAFPGLGLVLRLSRNMELAARTSGIPDLVDGAVLSGSITGRAKVPAEPPRDILSNNAPVAGSLPSKLAPGAAAVTGSTDGNAAAARREPSPYPGRVQFLENGIWFWADVLKGQKTGFFLDQRENRREVESLARGRSVLNAFSFSGGFSLYAARGGAGSVVSLDISEHALREARENFQLNAADPAIASVPHETIQADVFEWFREPHKRRFGLVIVDPPSLAKREIERQKAIGAYRQLNVAAIQHLEPDGILLAASCSAHVSSEEFFGAVREAARMSGRRFKELKTAGHPPDHRANFPEAAYLKAIYLRFDGANDSTAPVRISVPARGSSSR